MNKNIVMCLSPGRSGTQLLTHLLGLADDTHSVHEPQPTFQAVTEAVRTSSDETLRFVRDTKLPAILSTPEANYVETSHLFGKGPFEAFVELGVPFRLMILNREPREVAKSHWRIKAVPARSKKKQQYLLRPDLEGVLSLPGWERMSDYQLCYWYCLEIERRKDLYSAECRRHGIPVIELSLSDALDFDRLQSLCAELGLPLPDTARTEHADLTKTKVNRKGKYLPKLSLKPLATQEEELWATLGDDGAELYEQVAARYGWETPISGPRRIRYA